MPAREAGGLEGKQSCIIRTGCDVPEALYGACIKVLRDEILVSRSCVFAIVTHAQHLNFSYDGC